MFVIVFDETVSFARGKNLKEGRRAVTVFKRTFTFNMTSNTRGSYLELKRVPSRIYFNEGMTIIRSAPSI
jgi:hypothetical protein